MRVAAFRNCGQRRSGRWAGVAIALSARLIDASTTGCTFEPNHNRTDWFKSGGRSYRVGCFQASHGVIGRQMKVREALERYRCFP